MFTFLVGTWLSLVEHRVRDAGVAGSNPVVPTTTLHLPLPDKPRKKFKRAIIRGFRVRRKTAAGKLSHFEMIGDTLAADPLPRTWVVCAIAFF